jgi:hypothetical protein
MWRRPRRTVCPARQTRRRAADQRPGAGHRQRALQSCGCADRCSADSATEDLRRDAPELKGDTLCSHSSFMSPRPFPKPWPVRRVRGEGQDRGRWQRPRRRRDEGLDRREGDLWLRPPAGRTRPETAGPGSASGARESIPALEPAPRLELCARCLSRVCRSSVACAAWTLAIQLVPSHPVVDVSALRTTQPTY